MSTREARRHLIEALRWSLDGLLPFPTLTYDELQEVRAILAAQITELETEYRRIDRVLDRQLRLAPAVLPIERADQ